MVYGRENIPSTVRVRSQFSKAKSKIRWAKAKRQADPYELRLPDFCGKARPLIEFADLDTRLPLSEPCLIGIDLVASATKESGYCILKGKHADTCRIKTDDDMLALAKQSGATLVSIDSPLSMPEGRTSVFDDDPKRNEFGITRQCERILKSRGINSYPCLIPSMQKLTQRGMELAAKFRKAGIAVIEVYPGAAQDIMCIPRKQAGLEYLRDGLVEFGIAGSFTRVPVSHDELDAITAAIVGLFYRAGMCERLGNEKEGYLVIPDPNTGPAEWLNRQATGLGEISSKES